MPVPAIDERRSFGPVTGAMPGSDASYPDRTRYEIAAERVATVVGERLDAGGDGPWTGQVLDAATMSSHLAPLDAGLYDGLAGLTFLFASMFGVTGSSRYEALTAASAQRLREQIDHGALRRFDVGLEGAGGIAYASLHAWLATEDDDARVCLVRACEALVARVARRERAVHVDVVGGEAGALLALMAIIERDVVSGDLLVETARRLVDQLLDASVVIPSGRVWPIFEDGLHIVGLGHGTSGIVAALHRASAIGHRSAEIHAAIDEAVAYEDQHLDPALGNWSDPRRPAHPAPLSSWCYGAAGVRLVRRQLGRPPPVGCVGALGHDVRPVDHVCCGTAGRLLVAITEGDPGADTAAAGLCERVLDGTVRLDLPASNRRLEEIADATSLFVGLPGIAFALLRAAHPDDTPELLLLS